MTEISIHKTGVNIDLSIHVVPLRNNDINCCQYRKIQFKGICLSIETRDNCCILWDGSICIIFSIVMDNNSYRLEVKKFVKVEDFYDIGMLSSVLQIYKCSMVNNDIFYVSLDGVLAKCYKMPLWFLTMMEDSDNDEEDAEITAFVVAALVHNEKL